MEQICRKKPNIKTIWSCLMANAILCMFVQRSVFVSMSQATNVIGSRCVSGREPLSSLCYVCIIVLNTKANK